MSKNTYRESVLRHGAPVVNNEPSYSRFKQLHLTAGGLDDEYFADLEKALADWEAGAQARAMERLVAANEELKSENAQLREHNEQLTQELARRPSFPFTTQPTPEHVYPGHPGSPLCGNGPTWQNTMGYPPR